MPHLETSLALHNPQILTPLTMERFSSDHLPEGVFHDLRGYYVLLVFLFMKYNNITPGAVIEFSYQVAPECLVRSSLRLNGQSTKTCISNADRHRIGHIKIVQM